MKSLVCHLLGYTLEIDSKGFPLFYESQIHGNFHLQDLPTLTPRGHFHFRHFTVFVFKLYSLYCLQL